MTTSSDSAVNDVSTDNMTSSTNAGCLADDIAAGSDQTPIDNLKAIPQFFAPVESLLDASKVHVVFMQNQKQLHPDKPTRELQRLSDTHWECKYSKCHI